MRPGVCWLARGKPTGRPCQSIRSEISFSWLITCTSAADAYLKISIFMRHKETSEEGQSFKVETLS